jgi:hypothetical protein
MASNTKHFGQSDTGKPLAIDLFCGLGGWTEGLLAENYRVIGFDIERHAYGEHRYPGSLVIQDVLTLHGSQFRDAALIVASPPCQAFSWMSMPWSRAKAKAAAIRADETGQMRADLTRLFDACFRIQREACEAAGRHIPLIVENVRGAQPWVGRSRWAWGSFHLFGDVPALMPIPGKVPAKRAMDDLKYGQRKLAHAHLPVGNGPLGRNDGTENTGFKSSGMNWSDRSIKGQDFTRIAGRQALADGVKQGGSGAVWFDKAVDERRKEGTKALKDGGKAYGGDFGWDGSPLRRGNSKSTGRKAASAMIAKIPLPLSRFIAKTFRP